MYVLNDYDDSYYDDNGNYVDDQTYTLYKFPLSGNSSPTSLWSRHYHNDDYSNSNTSFWQAAVDGKGNFYFIEDSTQFNGDGSVTESANLYKVLAGANTGFFLNATIGDFLTADATGNIFGTTASTIYKIPTGSNAANILYTYPSGTYPFYLAADGLGNIYTMIQIGNDPGRIDKISQGGYTITPALPAGLSFDNTTGIINGTPTSSSPAITYTVTASNSTGNNSTNIVIEVTSDPSAQNAIESDNQQVIVGEPIQLGTGTYAYSHTDLSVLTVNSSLTFTRAYNSLNNSLNSPMGYGWSHSYNYQLAVQKDPVSGSDKQWNIQFPDGHSEVFIPLTNGSGQSSPLYTGTTDSLVKNTGADFILFTKDNHQYHFTAAGVLNQISDLNANITTLSYTGSNLTIVTGPGGRMLKLTYNSTNVATVADPLNRSCAYTYDANGNLTGVKDANGSNTTFTYDTNHRMLSATDPLGNIIVSNTYDAQGRVINQLDAYSQATAIAYDTPLAGDATVTYPDNSQIIAHHDAGYRKTPFKDELGYTKTYAYDANGNENIFTDENG